jgi:hypothetical protein
VFGASVLHAQAWRGGRAAARVRALGEGRSGIKVAVLELEPTVDIRLTRFLRRLGFDRKSINMTYVRSSL